MAFERTNSENAVVSLMCAVFFCSFRVVYVLYVSAITGGYLQWIVHDNNYGRTERMDYGIGVPKPKS